MRLTEPNSVEQNGDPSDDSVPTLVEGDAALHDLKLAGEPVAVPSSLTLSYSRISTYQPCPLRYKFEYIDRLPTVPKPYFSFGASLHSALEFFFEKPMGPPDRRELLDCLDRVWLSEGYRSSKEEADQKAVARRILGAFWFVQAPVFRPALAPEHEFSIDLGGIGLRGILARVDSADGQDGIELTDYKSGKYIWRDRELAENLQLTLYQLASEEGWRMPVRRLSLYHLRSNRPYHTQPRSKETLDGARRMIHQVAEDIEARRFEPKLGRFCPCDFSTLCPIYDPSARR